MGAITDSSAAIGPVAQAWWKILQRECPPQWLQSMPELDLSSPTREFNPRYLPVIEQLSQMLDQAGPAYSELIEALVAAREVLYFGQTYTASDFGAKFLDHYGWLKLLGPDGYWHSDVLSSGLLFLGDRITYPQHWHDAEEIYLPVSGDAQWYREGQGWQMQPVGNWIHHPGGIKHGTRTLGQPLIALYLWRGGNLTQKSSIR